MEDSQVSPDIISCPHAGLQKVWEHAECLSLEKIRNWTYLEFRMMMMMIYDDDIWWWWWWCEWWTLILNILVKRMWSMGIQPAEADRKISTAARFQQLLSRMRRSQRLGAEPWAFLQGPAEISPLAGRTQIALWTILYYVLVMVINGDYQW
jgi:hypothetical protein